MGFTHSIVEEVNLACWRRNVLLEKLTILLILVFYVWEEGYFVENMQLSRVTVLTGLILSRSQYQSMKGDVFSIAQILT